MIVIANTLIIVLISTGVIFTVVAAIGILRLPDVYTRSHAATKSVTFGVLCTLIGVFLYFWLIEGHFNVTLLLGIVFIFATAPIGGHLMARAAYLSGVKPSSLTIKDDLKEVIEKGKREDRDSVEGK
ncbi:monovalent cation/H(+) antiporter subunit G [Lentibacillus sp. N15]|uniref:monovalent cation/H(+) antiporter subunit G n=1 Tax=Lentibacillus songyuanensis TaxID=3136161 RepID=UPI0031BBABEB